MQLLVINTNGYTNTTLTIQGEAIAYQDSYLIPSANLAAWAGDLTFCTYICSQQVTLQDDVGAPLPPDVALDLMMGIANGKISTS